MGSPSIACDHFLIHSHSSNACIVSPPGADARSCAVNGTQISLVLNGTNITVPVTSGTSRRRHLLHTLPAGAAALTALPLFKQPPPVALAAIPPSASSVAQFSRPARRLWYLPLQHSSPVHADYVHPWLPRPTVAGRQLQQSPAGSGVYVISLKVTKCAEGAPVTDATASAFLSNQLQNATIQLTQAPPSSDTYAGTLDLDSKFPNLTFSVTATVDFCNANQQAVKALCSVGASGGGYSSQSGLRNLLKACTAFLTDSSVSEANAASQV